MDSNQKKLEYNNYNLVYETVQNFFRTFVTLTFVIRLKG